MNKKLKTGDIFYIQVGTEAKFVFGRVLFHVKKQYKIKKEETGYFSYLELFHNESQLVEMFDGIYDDPSDFNNKKILIPSVLTKPIDSKNNTMNWGIVENNAVDYTSVEFPENLNIKNNKVYLDRGELSIETSFQTEDANFKSLMYFPATIVNASLDFQNRRDLIPDDVRWPQYIRDRDLRYHSQLRETIYDTLQIDPNKSYYELSREMGFDLARFY